MASILYWMDTAAHGVVALVTVSLLLLAQDRGGRRGPNNGIGLLMATVSLWAGSSIALRYTVWLNQGTQQFWAGLSALGAVLIGPLLLAISCIDIRANRRWLLVLSAAMVLLTGLISVPFLRQQIVAGVHLEAGGILRWDWTLLGEGLLILLSACAFLALALLGSRYRESHSYRRLLLAVFLVTSGLLVSFLALPFPALGTTALMFVSIAGCGVQVGDFIKPLKENEQDRVGFSTLSESSPESPEGGILVYNNAGYITFANPRIARLLGYSPGDLTGRHMTTVVAPEHVVAFAREADQQHQGSAGSYETVLLTRQEQPIPVTFISRPLLEDTRLGYAIAVSAPEAKLSRVEELLEKEREAFFNVLQRTAYGALVIDQSGRCLYVNPEFTNIVGYSLEDIPTVSDWLRRAWPDLDRRREVVDAWKGDATQRLGGVFRIDCKGGEQKEVRLEIIKLDDGRAILVLSDIGERERLLAALQRRSAQLRAAAEASQSASVAISPEELMSRTVNLIRERFAFDHVGLFLVSSTGEAAELQAEAGDTDQYMLEESRTVQIDSKSSIGWSIANAEACVALRVGEEATRLDSLGLAETRSEMILPLLARGNCIGALAVHSAQKGAFEAQDAVVLQSVADHLAMAIQNARLYAQARARSRHLEALLKITTTLRDALPLSSVLEAIAQATREALDCAGSIIAVPDRENEQLILGAASGDSMLEAAAKLAGVTMKSFRVPLTAKENPVVQAFLSGETLAWNVEPDSIAKDVRPPLLPRFASVIEQTVGSRLASCVPLTVGETVLGVLVAFSPRGELTGEGRAVLIGLAEQAGLAIANSHLNEAFQQELIKRNRLNQQIQKRRLYLESLLDCAPDAIVTLDERHNISEWNAGAERLFGHSRVDVLGLNIDDIIASPNAEAFEEATGFSRRILRGERVPPTETVRYRKDGTPLDVIVTGAPIIVKDKLAGAVAVYTGFTELKQAQEALRRSESQYRTTLDAMGDAMHVVDSNLQLTLFNAAFREWNEELGLETNVIGREVFEVFPFLPESVRDEYLHVFDTGEMLVTEDVTKVGEETYVTETRKIPVFHDGQVTQVVTVIRDITERKRTEEALRESEEKFRTVAEQSPNMIFINKQGRIAYANEKCEEVLGFARDELYAPGFDHLKPFSPDYRELVEASFARHALGEEVGPYEYTLTTKDGGNIDAILSTRLIPYEGETAILGTVTDVSELKRAELELQRRNRELELLNQAGQVFSSTLDMDRILTTVLEETRQTLDATACSVWLTDPVTLELVCRQATGPQNERVRGWRLAPGEGIAGWVASTGESLNVPDVRTNGRHFRGVALLTGLELRSILSVPLRLRDKVIGVLQVVDSEAERFNDTDLALLEPLAATAATAIENARLYEQARQDAAVKSVLLQEVNHRVKNNLSAIIGLLRAAQRRADSEDGSSYQSVMGELTNLVQGLATVHDLLSASEWSPLLLSELADQIIRSSLRTLSQGERVQVDVSPSSVLVTPDQAHNLTLIMNELTTNAVKHALPGREQARITVSIDLKGDIAAFQFRDDGPGYPVEALQLRATCIGLDLVQKITRRSLHGHLSLHNDRGAVAVIRFRSRAQKAKGLNE